MRCPIYFRYPVVDPLALLDDAQDHSELGAALNGFSLNESGELAAAIEKTGQAVDATYLQTTKLVSDNHEPSCLFPDASSVRRKNSSKIGLNHCTNMLSLRP